MATYKILSLDGGGIRGVLTAVLIRRLMEAEPAFLANVDLIAGTSTGAILGLALAKGLDPQAIIDLYKTQGPAIFHHDFATDLSHLWGLSGAKYGTDARYKALAGVFGTAKLADLNKRVVIATIDLDSSNAPEADPNKPARWKAKFFHNFDNPGTDANELALDVAMRSSAAPVYFPMYQGFVDGGLVANNPSMCALAQALAADSGNQDPKNVVMLSIGTGDSREFVPEIDARWGLMQWNFKLISLPLAASEGVADYQSKQILGDCYRRIQPPLTKPIPLDDVGSITELERIASQYVIDNDLNWLSQQWR